MLTTLSELLIDANKRNYAVGAFNINNLEIIQAVIAAAEAEKAPVIVQTSEGALEYAGMDELAGLVHIAAKKASVPVVFHLDHGKNVELVKKAIDSGYYTSVMIDASSLPFEENVKVTREIVKRAHKKGISVEAELGAISGTEDNISVTEKEAMFTDPEEAEVFVKETGCDALAISVGTSHGPFKFIGSSRLDYKRIKAVKQAVKIPLVLHGASGIPASLKKQCKEYGCKIDDAKGVSDRSIKKAVSFGVNKINVDTDIRIAFDAGIRKFLTEHPEVIDPRKILGSAKDLIQKTVQQKMRLFGCSGRAANTQKLILATNKAQKTQR